MAADQYFFAGTSATTGGLLFRRVDGTTSGTPYYSILAADSGSVYSFTANSFAVWAAIGTSNWGDYVTALSGIEDVDESNIPVFESQDGWASLSAGVYIIQIYAAATYNSALVGRLLLYYDGISDWQEVDKYMATTADAILVDTGTTLPEALTYDKDDVSPERTWSWPVNSGRVQSPQIVRVHPSFDGTLAFDLSNLLNEGSGISSVTSVTVSPSGPTVSGPNGGASPTKNSNNTKVLFDIDGGQSDSTDYTFTCTVTTTDSDDALVHTGLMQSRST